MAKQWHGGKGSQRRNSNEKLYSDNWDTIFGKKTEVKVRKVTPSHGLTQVQKDKTKYNRKAMTKADMLKGPELI
jgi:hypothetical protein|tara:strand:+ start:334 stop:555 length:222 start_codon:yes stop_codon:yes gene_type:complete